MTVGEIQAEIEITKEQDAGKALELDRWLGRVLNTYQVLPWTRRRFGSGLG